MEAKITTYLVSIFSWTSVLSKYAAIFFIVKYSKQINTRTEFKMVGIIQNVLNKVKKRCVNSIDRCLDTL